MSILIRNASVLTLDQEDRFLETSDILIDGDRIAAIGDDLVRTEAGATERVIDGTGLLAMPGLINGHFHSASAFMKGAFDGFPLEVYMLRETPSDDLASGQRAGYLRTMLSALELIKLGVTSVRDDQHFFLPAADDTIDVTLQAYADAGIRASVGIADPNLPEYATLPFLQDMLPQSAIKAMDARSCKSTADMVAMYDRAFARWHNHDGGRLAIHVSCSAPQRVTRETMKALAALAQEHDVAFDMHILETKMQYVHGREDHGQSLIAYVDDIGALNENSVVIHAVWADDDDIVRMANAGAMVAHNPVSNLALGSGVMSLRKMIDAGVPVCLGTDEASVDESNNLWINAKVGTMLQRIDQPDYDQWPAAETYLNCIMDGGARALRKHGELGQLREGALADIILLDLDRMPFVPLNNLKRQLVTAETGSSVVMTMVAGRVICENGRVLTVDEAAIKDEIRAMWPRYRALCDAFNRERAELETITHGIYDRCAQSDIGFTRWIGG
ncbi:MAG: amidohydrolase family protein [Pseudomonadota bacterium]